MFARIGTRDVPVVKAEIDQKQNEPTTFNITVPAVDFADREDLLYEDVALYRRDVKLVSGIVWDKPLLEMGSDRQSLVYSVRCTDEIGRLSLVRADFFLAAHYQDVLVLDILLALMPVGWALGGTATMFQPTLKTTVDLRGKETRLAQILAVVKTIPKLWIRYGGIGTGNHLLDVGYFGQKTAYAVQGGNLKSLRLESNTTPQVRIVEAYADAGAGTSIRLQNALGYMIAFGYSADITSDPDWAQFPIVEEPAASGHFVVENTALARGGELTKSFNIHRPRMDTLPTIQEVTQAAFAMWKDAVRFLQKSTNYKSYELEAHFAALPPVNDKIYVNAVAREYLFATDDGAPHEVESYHVEDTFHIVGVHTEIEEVMQQSDTGAEDEPAIICTVNVTDNDYIEEVEQEDDYQEQIRQVQLPAQNSPPIGEIIEDSIDDNTPDPSDTYNTADGRCAVADFIGNQLHSLLQELTIRVFRLYTYTTAAFVAESTIPDAASGVYRMMHLFPGIWTEQKARDFADYMVSTGAATVRTDSDDALWTDIRCGIKDILDSDTTITITTSVKAGMVSAISALGGAAAGAAAALLDALTLNAVKQWAFRAAPGSGWCDDCVTPDAAKACGLVDFSISRWGWHIPPQGYSFPAAWAGSSPVSMTGNMLESGIWQAGYGFVSTTPQNVANTLNREHIMIYATFSPIVFGVSDTLDIILGVTSPPVNFIESYSVRVAGVWQTRVAGGGHTFLAPNDEQYILRQLPEGGDAAFGTIDGFFYHLERDGSPGPPTDVSDAIIRSFQFPNSC